MLLFISRLGELHLPLSVLTCGDVAHCAALSEIFIPFRWRVSVWKLPQCSWTHNRDVNTMFIAEASTLSVSPRLAAHSNRWEDINTRQLCGVTLIRNKQPNSSRKKLQWVLKRRCLKFDCSHVDLC